jgi:NADH-quinone oxidoreductase subunit G
MTAIYIDGRKHTISEDGKNLLEVCLSLGYDVPYFCWHPALGSVGACRQCAVKKYRDEDDRQGRIVMSCMEPVVDGIRISISDPEVHEFRANIISWLMINHPHDCPVCDEGGECHLQDMTVMTGHNYRTYRFKKQTFRNQNLGPFINHEMNRCIQCFRCVRYYRDYAGGRDLNAFASRDRTYFGRESDGTLESEFSGNLVEVCPTGVFTDKTLKQHYTRKWDLQNAPSICTHCSLGCNIIAGERSGKLRRVVNRFNSHINGYFLCDRGRFGYDFVNSSERLLHPLHRTSKNSAAEPGDADQMLNNIREALGSGQKAIGIGSTRASLEANHALRRLVGPERFFHGVNSRQHELDRKAISILSGGPNRILSLSECASADAVLVLGEDPTNTAPMLDLALRQAVRQQPLKKARENNIPSWNDAALRESIQDEKGPLYIVSPGSTKLDGIAKEIFRAGTVDTARFGMAVAHAIDSDAPDPEKGLSKEILEMAGRIAQDLMEATNPLIISGTTFGGSAFPESAANIARALYKKNENTGLFLIFPECNSAGLAMMDGGDLDEAVAMIENGSADTVFVLETDLYRHLEPSVVDRLFEKAAMTVVLDHLQTPTVLKADIALPTGTFAESDGTLVNNEGRAQRFFKVHLPPEGVCQSRNWLSSIAGATETETLDDLILQLVKDLPQFGGIEKLDPPANQKIPRQSHRYSGRTALKANIRVSESKPPEDPDSPLVFSMEGVQPYKQFGYLPLVWAPGWNSAQAINKFQSEIGGPLRSGEAGLRLINPANSAPGYRKTEKIYTANNEGFSVTPLFHIFGSEELSSRAAALATRIPKPYLAVNPRDAEKLEIGDGSEIELTCGNTKLQIPVKLNEHLPEGNIGYPVGLPGMPHLDIPGYAKIRKVGK